MMCVNPHISTGRINKIRKYLTDSSVKTLVQSLVTSRMDYCNSVYTCLPAKIIKKLQYAHNSAARIITKTGKYNHITPVLKILHWIPINKRAEYKRMVLVFNSLHHKGPSYISDILHWYKPARLLRSQSSSSLVPTNGRSIVINRRLLQGGCSRAWNNLPEYIRCVKSFSSFKILLKTYYFNISYS